MNENEARLVYKNKITKITNLALFILSAILVYLTSFFSGIGVFGGGVGSSNSGLVYFLRGYCIFIFVLEVIVFIYRLWRMAWIKENPERIYGTLAVSKADSSRTPTKTSSKTPSKSPKPVEIEATPKAIGAIDAEVKEIEVKK